MKTEEILNALREYPEIFDKWAQNKLTSAEAISKLETMPPKKSEYVVNIKLTFLSSNKNVDEVSVETAIMRGITHELDIRRFANPSDVEVEFL